MNASAYRLVNPAESYCPDQDSESVQDLLHSSVMIQLVSIFGRAGVGFH